MFEYNRKKFNKKIATLFVFVVLFSSFSPIFARKAEAFFFVDWVNLVVNTVSSLGDYAIWIKEYGLDAIAYQMINLVIEKMTASTVNWINSGFQGSPAFVTDPEAYYKDMGDKIAGQYIFSNPNLNFLCGPISAKIRLTLAQNYIQERQWQCTLSEGINNMEGFMNNFENGGWDNFFEITQRQQNNPIGAYLQAENELNLQIATRQGTAQTELNQGGGFMSFKKCKPGTESPSGGSNQCAASYNDCLNAGTGDRTSLCSEALRNCDKNLGNIAPGDCKDSDKEIVTPGSVISDKLNSVLNTGDNRLAAADSINQIITALMQQVTSQIVGGIGRGLRGMSKPDSTSGQTFTSQLSTPEKDAQATNYFISTASSSEDVLNMPVFNPNICREDPSNPDCNPPPGYCDPSDTTCTGNTNNGTPTTP